MRFLIKLFAFISLLLSLFILFDRYEIQQNFKVVDVLHQIDPLPKTKEYIKREQYVQADEYLSFFIQYDYVKKDPNAKRLLHLIRDKRADIEYKTKKVMDGVAYGKSDELEGQIAAGISDFFLFGDLRDLTIEGYHHIRGEKVDTVLVALSSIGVVATGMSVISGGTTLSTKGAISFLKFTKKSGKMPKWLGKYLVKSAKNMNKIKSLDAIKELFSDIYILIKASGLQGGMKLLSKTGSLKSLQKAKTFSKTFGKNSSALVDILGSDTLLLFNKSKLTPKVFMKASTYGKTGVKRAIKLGEKRFSKSLIKTAKVSRISKIFGKNINHMLKSVPSYLFILVALISFVIVV